MQLKRIYILLIVLFISTSFHGCTKPPKPENVIKQMVNYWNESRYEDILYLVSRNIKENINEQDFIERYENITNGCGIEKIELIIKEQKPSTQNNNMDYSYSLKFTSSIVEDFLLNYTAKLVLENNEWRIQWAPELIFPQLVDNTDKVQVIRNTSPRANIIDRNGNALTSLQTMYSIGIDIGRITDQKLLIHNLNSLLDITPSVIEQKLAQDWVQPGLFIPIKTVSSTIDDDTYRKLLDTPGVIKRDIQIRVYEPSLSHTLGYVQEISTKQLQEYKDKDYRSGDFIGASGIEQLLETTLRTKPTYKIITTSEEGKEKYLVTSTTPQKPIDISLTIDLNLQKILDESMNGTKGAAIIMNAKNGHILGIISTPYYDSSNLVAGLSNEEWENINKDEKKPLFNRATQALYTPGSVIKPFVALIGLEENTLDLNEHIDTSAGKWQYDKSWGNYYITTLPHEYSTVNLERAIKKSDNIYFAQQAMRFGPKIFVDYFLKMAFEEDLKLLINVSKSTISNSGTLNNSLLLANTGYGQGELLTTPLHMTAMFSAIINNGNMLKPIILYEDNKEQIWKSNIFEPSNCELIKDMLGKVITEGTAQDVRMEDLSIAGKTGTAQIGNNNVLRWFISYAPIIDTEYIITVVLEDTVDREFSAVQVSKRIYNEMRNQGYFTDN